MVYAAAMVTDPATIPAIPLTVVTDPLFSRRRPSSPEL